MNTPATLLNALIIEAHDGSNASFCQKHGVKKQTISSITNGTGNSRLSFAKLEEWANKDGYTVGTVLHRHTGDTVADALAHVRAAALQARHVIEWQEDLTPEMRDQMDFLDNILDKL